MTTDVPKDLLHKADANAKIMLSFRLAYELKLGVCDPKISTYEAKTSTESSKCLGKKVIQFTRFWTPNCML